jgi:hypothetical protein
VRGLFVITAVCVLLVSANVLAQATPAGANWQRVQQLPLHTHVHVASDKMSRVCEVDSVDAETLRCSAGRMVNTAHYTFARSEIKSIKVTRYIGSTIGGAAIGAASGLVIGVGVAHSTQSFPIVSNKAIWGIFSVAGGIAGGLIGGPTDFLRGPTIYKRP